LQNTQKENCHNRNSIFIVFQFSKSLEKFDSNKTIFHVFVFGGGIMSFHGPIYCTQRSAHAEVAGLPDMTPPASLRAGRRRKASNRQFGAVLWEPGMRRVVCC
jgi:hypothetical protein